MAIQTIYRGVEGDSSKKFTAGSAFDTAQANDEYLDSVKPTVIENVAALASTPVVSGTVYYLKEYTTGTGCGGGFLVGKAGSTTYNNVTTYAGSGGYFERLWDGKEVNITWAGVVPAISGVPSDTTSTQQAVWDSTEWTVIYYPAGRYSATMLTQDNTSREKIYGDGAIIFGVASSATRCLFELKNGNGFEIYGIAFSGNQNANYTCGMHWYTNDLDSYYPGKAKIDIEITEFVLGVNVGMLASQTTYYAQGTVQADGIATDAPLSECSVRIITKDCPSGFRICQPNGKLTLVDSLITAEGSGWASPPAASTWVAFELERFGEVAIIGGSLECVSSASGTLIKQNSGSLFIESAVVESLGISKFSSTNSTSYAVLRISKMLNFGFNSTTLPVFWVKDDSCGDIVINNSWVTFPYQNMSSGTALLAKGVSSLSTGAYAEAPNVTVSMTDCELRDPAWPTATAWVMGTLGVKCKFSNTNLTSFTNTGFENTPRTALTRLNNIGTNVLASLIDNSCANITASPVTTPTTTGGWTFTSGGGTYAYGRVTPAATLNVGSLNGVAQTPTYALRMQANAAVSLTAESPSFNCEPFSSVLVTGWVYVVAAGATNAKIKLNSRDFSDASISTANLATGNVNLLQSGWQPFMVWGKQVATGSKARLQLYVENGSEVQWFGVSVYVDK